MKKLQGKKIVVIGGSSGTGLAIVNALREQAADVLMVARDSDALDIHASKDKGLRILSADITHPDTAQKIFQDSPDIVILAAGAMPTTQPFYKLDWETFSINWNADVKAAFILAKYSLTNPVKPGTTIIFISSGAAVFGSPISGGYAGSKRTQMFLANYAQESSNKLKLGLRFIALAPWRLMKDTRIGERVIPGYADYLGVSEQDFISRMPMAQSKEDVARAVTVFANQSPPIEEGNVFIISSKGVIMEADVPKTLMGMKVEQVRESNQHILNNNHEVIKQYDINYRGWIRNWTCLG